MNKINFPRFYKLGLIQGNYGPHSYLHVLLQERWSPLLLTCTSLGEVVPVSTSQDSAKGYYGPHSYLHVLLQERWSPLLLTCTSLGEVVPVSTCQDSSRGIMVPTPTYMYSSRRGGPHFYLLELLQERWYPLLLTCTPLGEVVPTSTYLYFSMRGGPRFYKLGLIQGNYGPHSYLLVLLQERWS